CDVAGQRLEEANPLRRKCVHLGVLDVENADQLTAHLEWNVDLRTRILLTRCVERNFSHIRRVKGPSACRRMRTDADPASDREAGAFQTQFSGPPRSNHEVVAVRVFEEHTDTVVPKRVRHILDDLVEKRIEIERGVDLLRHTLEQVEILDIGSCQDLVGAHGLSGCCRRTANTHQALELLGDRPIDCFDDRERDRGYQSAHPSAIQRSNSEIRSAGHAPSHGIVPALRRAWIASAWVRTSATDQRSNAKRIAPRSRARNKPLMCRSKLSASPGAAGLGGARGPPRPPPP